MSIMKQDIKKLMAEYRKKRKHAINVGYIGLALGRKLKRLDAEYLEALKLIKRKHGQ